MNHLEICSLGISQPTLPQPNCSPLSFKEAQGEVIFVL